MILMYSKSGILLQLHFLWSLNSNLQIIVNYCLREKISTTTLCTKTKSIQELKVLIHFILHHHHLQSKKLSTSTIEHFSHYGCPQVSEKERMTPKVCQFPSKYIYTTFMGVSDLVKQPNANGKQKTYLYCMLHLEAFWPLISTRWLFQHSWFLKICLPNISSMWGAQSAWLGRPNYKEISRKEVNHSK